MLKLLRTKRLNLEEFDQCELDKIKDLFQYLQIAMPISLTTLQWDSSKCYGGISVQDHGSAIVANSSNYYDDTMVLGKRSVSRFRVELGEGLTSCSAYVGFISSKDFVKDRSIVNKGWSMAFFNNGSNFSMQYNSRTHHFFENVTCCILTALHVEDRNEITFKLKSKEGRLLLEYSFQGIQPKKKLHPFVLFGRMSQPNDGLMLLRFQ